MIPRAIRRSPSGRDNQAVAATIQTLVFRSGAGLRRESVDIRFDGHRVWSTEVSCDHDGWVRLEWPVSLRGELYGETEITVGRASNGEVLATGTVQFDDSHTRTVIADSRRRLLAVNKWGNLGVPLESQRKGTRKRLLANAHRIMADLTSLGFRPFLSSGSLLGAMRNGAFLPHDDDIDLGNLTDTQHPAELVVESERLERSLAARGYTVVRHSHAHLQIVFLRKSGELDHYIDIFTAYFDPDGTFNQPFSIRGRLEREALQPFSEVALEKHLYSAPALPQKWLELNYGPRWRDPDPGFKFEIPDRTRRRFDSWFGTFNLHRDFWESAQTGEALSDRGDPAFVLEALDGVPPDSEVLDVGVGLSRTPASIRDAGRSVSAADFSLPALLAQSRQLDRRQVGFLNLNDRHAVLDFALSRLSGGKESNLVFEHVLEGLSGEGKLNALLLMRWMLGAERVAVVTFHTDLPDDYAFEDPTSWHVPVDQFESMASAHGLAAEIVRVGSSSDDHGRTRATAYAIVRRREALTQ